MNETYQLVRFNSDDHFLWHEVHMHASANREWLKAHAQEYHRLFHGDEQLQWTLIPEGLWSIAPSHEKSYPFINYQISEVHS